MSINFLKTLARTAFSAAFLMLCICSHAQSARWISADHPERDNENTWIEFRKAFVLDGKHDNATARIAADSKYWLWINGKSVVFEGGLKRGPDPRSSYFDVVDLGPYLKKGRNDIRLLLWHFGKDGFSHKDSGASGMIFDAEGIGLVSDSSWESRKLSEYQTAVSPKPNYRLPESSIRYDAGIAGKDAWSRSVELGAWGEGPWGRLIERPVPLWKDYGIKKLGYTETTDGKGNTILVAKLPYNTQMTPVLELTDKGEGTCIRIETDHIRGGSDDCIYAEYITRNGRQSYESLGWMNGDELRIIYPAESGVTVHSVGYRESGFDCGFEGSFTCSDETVNRFWTKAMRTLYVNMRDTYFDCPDRERAQWWGDVTVLMGQSFYQLSPKANSLMNKAIHELAAWQKEDGTLYSPVPAGSWHNELPAQMLASISTYGFWYYHMHTGDSQTIADVYPAVRKYLSLWTLDEDGLTAFRKGGWSWGDWGSNIDIRLILAAWHYLALESAANMAGITGNEADIAGYRKMMASIKEAYNRCWNGREYRHPSYEGETDDRVNAMAIIAGIADSSIHDALFEFFKKSEHASPYMEKYVLEALVKTGHGDYALERFRRRFRNMIEDPAHTTLYEGWEEGGFGGGSTNHAWSGGMLTVIAENICGVRPTVPGWSEFEICPDPVIPQCDITIPSVKGMIRSAFEDTPEEFSMNFTVPEGTTAHIRLPGRYSKIKVNGKEYDGNWKFEAGKYKVRCTKETASPQPQAQADVDTDPRVREYISPTGIIWAGNPELISNADFLLRKGNGQADLTNSHICVMKSTKDKHPSVLLDFGKELHGGLQIVTGMPASHDPIRVRIRFGESASEAMSEIGVKGATNDHAVRDFEMTLPWLGVRETGNSGFRFARIDLLDDNAELHLKEIRAVSSYREIPYRGSFSCSDERLNEIWRTGAYTVHLCMQDYLWDGIKRDRLVWMGDMHPEIMTISHVFGKTDVVPASLDLARDITPLPGWMSGMYTYSLWWVVAQRDWYRYHGDMDYLRQQRDYLTGLLKILLTRVDENGLETSGGGFLDWPSNANRPAMRAGTQALMMMTMQAGSELCSYLGEDELASRCARCHERMVKAAPDVCGEYYKEALAPGEPGSKQGTALMVLAGMTDAARASDNVLKSEGARGFSTFYGYYMLEAMAKAGDYEEAMEMIRTFWGGMLDLGATTFWEDFNIDWLKDAPAPIDRLVPDEKKDIHGDFGAYCYEGFRHSLCHGWASGPTAWLSRHVLGVEVVEPGCRVISIEPHLGNLEWAEGTFPTPYGDVRISHKKGSNGKIITKTDAPKGIRIILK